jgi:succinate dehydrogenase / fumarate reductase flavoprotein subunit/L-aspartate oxidase
MGNLYPEHRNLIEPTRGARRHETLPPLTPEQRETLLRAHHPDYNPRGYRTLRVGPNAGEATVHEIARLLEADSPLDPAMPLKPDHTVDVLVLGGGGAGVAAALTAAGAGASVLLATKLRLGDSNTVMAEGGMQVAVKPNDSPVYHYLDAMRGGHFKNDPLLLKTLVEEGPEAALWLTQLGVLFDREPDGSLRVKAGGGTSRARLLACKDYTGLDIMRTLKEALVNREIPVLEYAPAIELLSGAGGRCAGAVLRTFEDNPREIVVRAKAVILATGGCGRLHIQGFPTSNHFGATGDALPLAYRIGARLSFIDTFQYHPTGVIYPGYLAGALVTEGMRSLGAQLLNAGGERFIHELETRDVVAAAIIRECREGRGVHTPTGKVGVWLDTPMIELANGAGALADRFPNMIHQFSRCGIDIRQEAILVYPTLHYQNGGVRIDVRGATEVPGLYVAGEATGGIHGRNRLMGNSLLDIIVYGRRAGQAAAEEARGLAHPDDHRGMTLDHVRRFREAIRSAGLAIEGTSPVLVPGYIEKKEQTLTGR